MNGSSYDQLIEKIKVLT